MAQDNIKFEVQLLSTAETSGLDKATTAQARLNDELDQTRGRIDGLLTKWDTMEAMGHGAIDDLVQDHEKLKDVYGQLDDVVDRFSAAQTALADKIRKDPKAATAEYLTTLKALHVELDGIARDTRSTTQLEAVGRTMKALEESHDQTTAALRQQADEQDKSARQMVSGAEKQRGALAELQADYRGFRGVLADVYGGVNLVRGALQTLAGSSPEAQAASEQLGKALQNLVSDGIRAVTGSGLETWFDGVTVALGGQTAAMQAALGPMQGYVGAAEKTKTAAEQMAAAIKASQDASKAQAEEDAHAGAVTDAKLKGEQQLLDLELQRRAAAGEDPQALAEEQAARSGEIMARQELERQQQAAAKMQDAEGAVAGALDREDTAKQRAEAARELFLARDQLQGAKARLDMVQQQDETLARVNGAADALGLGGVLSGVLPQRPGQQAVSDAQAEVDAARAREQEARLALPAGTGPLADEQAALDLAKADKDKAVEAALQERERQRRAQEMSEVNAATALQAVSENFGTNTNLQAEMANAVTAALSGQNAALSQMLQKLVSQAGATQQLGASVAQTDEQARFRLRNPLEGYAGFNF
jgi:hypothetical protein